MQPPGVEPRVTAGKAMIRAGRTRANISREALQATLAFGFRPVSGF
jgi:hypothetical protein